MGVAICIGLVQMRTAFRMQVPLVELVARLVEGSGEADHRCGVVVRPGPAVDATGQIPLGDHPASAVVAQAVGLVVAPGRIGYCHGHETPQSVKRVFNLRDGRIDLWSISGGGSYMDMSRYSFGLFNPTNATIQIDSPI